MTNFLNTLKKNWPRTNIITSVDTDEDDDDTDANYSDDPTENNQAQNVEPDLTTMQTLVDGTAQALCLRLWKGYVSNDTRQFADFMSQIDGVTTNFVQALPVPVDPADLEDGDLASGQFSLPSIGPSDDTE